MGINLSSTSTKLHQCSKTILNSLKLARESNLRCNHIEYFQMYYRQDYKRKAHSYASCLKIKRLPQEISKTLTKSQEVCQHLKINQSLQKERKTMQT